MKGDNFLMISRAVFELGETLRGPWDVVACHCDQESLATLLATENLEGFRIDSPDTHGEHFLSLAGLWVPVVVSGGARGVTLTAEHADGKVGESRTLNLVH